MARDVRPFDASDDMELRRESPIGSSEPERVMGGVEGAEMRRR